MGEDPRSMRDRMLDGDLYIADDAIAREIQQGMALTDALNRTPASDPDQRRQILTRLLGAYGAGSDIRSPFYCEYGHQIRIGSGTFANLGLTILDVARVTIGDDVQIGPHVQLLTAAHPLEPGPRRDRWEYAKPIVIEDNVWLGGGVIVCPGVTIGENTVVGAGSVVTKDLTANVLAVGSPARVLRTLDGQGDPRSGR
jgi:maltose O-acetyltransferase